MCIITQFSAQAIKYTPLLNNKTCGHLAKQTSSKLSSLYTSVGHSKENLNTLILCNACAFMWILCETVCAQLCGISLVCDSVIKRRKGFTSVSSWHQSHDLKRLDFPERRDLQECLRPCHFDSPKGSLNIWSTSCSLNLCDRPEHGLCLLPTQRPNVPEQKNYLTCL